MNAGRDVERLIAGWLADEAAGRAPDRVLHAARRSIDRTGQRRFVVAWREPMLLSPMRLAGVAGLLVVALLGAALIGRASAPGGGFGSQPTLATANPSGAGGDLASYRIARNEICNRYDAVVTPLKPDLEGIYDLETPTEVRTAKMETLFEIVDQLEAMVRELDRLEAPAQLASGHDAYVTRYQDMTLFIRELMGRIGQRDFAGAAAVDDAIDALNAPMLQFETENALDICP